MSQKSARKRLFLCCIFYPQGPNFDQPVVEMVAALTLQHPGPTRNAYDDGIILLATGTWRGHREFQRKKMWANNSYHPFGMVHTTYLAGQIGDGANDFGLPTLQGIMEDSIISG